MSRIFLFPFHLSANGACFRCTCFSHFKLGIVYKLYNSLSLSFFYQQESNMYTS
jgi:hypothetical protein